MDKNRQRDPESLQGGSRKLIIGIDGNEANVKNRVGTGLYAYELLKQFAKDKNHSCLIYLKDSPLSDLPKETGNFNYKVFGPKKLWTQFALPFKLTFGPKINVFFSMAHYGPRFSKVPFVVTIHDLSYLHFPEMFKKNDLYQLTSWSKYSIKNAAHIIAVSKTTKEDIIKNYNIDPSKITVTYEGYDKNRFEPQPKTKLALVLKKYHVDGEYIIAVGTLQPRKNLERLIEAYSILNTKYTIQNTSLVIIGKKGWFYDAIFQKVKDLNLERKVIFTDYVPDDDLPALIGGAQVYVLPSLWEGFGIPVIEAQACGVPVVVSNISSLPEIVGESGILVDPESVESIAQGIKKVLTDKKTKSDLVKKGFKNTKRFSWQSCAQETLEVLAKVVSN
ncbi:MAG: glycosyltransferase family 1 protein [Patescibacteria group bacterium]